MKAYQFEIMSMLDNRLDETMQAVKHLKMKDWTSFRVRTVRISRLLAVRSTLASVTIDKNLKGIMKNYRYESVIVSSNNYKIIYPSEIMVIIV